MRTRKNLKGIQDQLEKLVSDLCVKHMLDLSKYGLNKKVAKLFKSDKLSEEEKEQLQGLREDLNCVFEWNDGILVESMEQGGLLLIDEISLANDSVLERLNSVFEQDRTLMVTEKSSQEALKIVAHEKFNMVATMNPSGDFGKKELSPALRNRMTEIWVESYFEQPELHQFLAEAQLAEDVITTANVPKTIDLYLIIKELVEDSLSKVV
jgi:midasin